MGEALVMMEGALHDLSEQDTAVVEENVKAAYNDAFWAAGLSLDTFKALTAAEEATGDSTIVIGEFAQVCSNTYNGMDDAKLARMHAAFEKAICSKLQKSGLVNFANVENCAFRMFGNHYNKVVGAVQTAKIAQQ